MALPGHRRNRAHRKERAVHYQLKKKSLTPCPGCSALKESHRACPHCGEYRGRKR